MTSRHRYTIAAASTAAFMLVTGCAGNAAGSTSPQSPHSTSPDSDISASPPAEATHTTTATPITATTPANTTAASACALVTEKDIITTLGADLGQGSPFTSHGSSQCQYGTYETQFVLVNLTPSHGNAAYARMRNNAKITGAGTVISVVGVGDQAFGFSAPHTTSIYFDKADALVLVSVENHTASSTLAAQTLTLSKKAASRL